MGCPCNKQFGGASHAPLSYLNRSYQEPSASASSQINRLGSEPLLARPVLNATGGRRTRHKKRRRTTTKRKGGFYPSVMGSLINNGSRLLPAAGVQAYRMVRNYKSRSRKNRK
jgi:hypothetical protein